jgi:DNA-binding CsgD family transcriptional regulator
LRSGGLAARRKEGCPRWNSAAEKASRRFVSLRGAVQATSGATADIVLDPRGREMLLALYPSSLSVKGSAAQVEKAGASGGADALRTAQPASLPGLNGRRLPRLVLASGPEAEKMEPPMSSKSSNRGTRMPAPDLVDLVEALYRPGPSWDEWLRLVGEKVRPLTDRHDYGIGAILYNCPDPCSFQPTRSLFWDVPDANLALLKRGLPSFPAAYIADAYLGGCYLASDCRGFQDIGPVKDGSSFSAGQYDGLNLNVVEPDGAGCWFGSPQSERVPLSEELHLELTRVRRHLAAAFRLRRRHANGRVSPDRAEAVIDEEGRVQHAAGPAAKGEAARGALSRAKRQMTRVRRGGPGSAWRGDIHKWESLVFDRWTLAEHVDTDGKRLTLAVDNRPAPPSLDLLSARELQVVLWAVAGHANKTIAYELGLSASTIRVLLSRAAAKVGARSRAELLQKVAKLEGR